MSTAPLVPPRRSSRRHRIVLVALRVVGGLAGVAAAVVLLLVGAPSDPCSPGVVTGDPGCDGPVDVALALAVLGASAVIAVSYFVFAAQLSRRWRRLVVFHAPAGWPPPPSGWEPPAGWQPHAAWPSPPAGWQFWVRRADEQQSSSS